MSDTQLTTMDLIHQCLDANAVNAADTLNALLGPRLVDAIQAKRVEVAQNMYGAPEQPTDSSSEEDQQPVTTEEEDENA